MKLEEQLRRHVRPFISDHELAALYSGTQNSRYGKVKRLIAQGKLLHIRRGLYGFSEKLGHVKKLHPFVLAQFVYAPSYISLETALAYHGLIPEEVYAILNATTKRSKLFTTPLGQFRYFHLPAENFYTGVNWVQDDENYFLMATPWKAICDYIYCHKLNWNSLAPLVESLRITLQSLPPLDEALKKELQSYYHHKRMTYFLKGVERELTLK